MSHEQTAPRPDVRWTFGRRPFKVDQLSEQQVEEFRDVFSIFDKKKTGVISISDFACAIEAIGLKANKNDVQAMSEDIDVHGNGQVTFSEFLNVLARKIKESETKEQMLRIFRTFDLDGDGTISTDEMRTVIHYLIEKVDQDEVEGIIKQIDPYNTGEIDYQEFVQAIIGRK